MNGVTIMGVCGGAAREALSTLAHLLHPGLAIGVNLAADRVGRTDWQVLIFVLQNERIVGHIHLVSGRSYFLWQTQKI